MEKNKGAAHSAKPEEVPARVEALVSGPYLELFARAPRPGWTVWGNEVDATPAGTEAAPQAQPGEPVGDLEGAEA